MRFDVRAPVSEDRNNFPVSILSSPGYFGGEAVDIMGLQKGVRGKGDEPCGEGLGPRRRTGIGDSVLDLRKGEEAGRIAPSSAQITKA